MQINQSTQDSSNTIRYFFALWAIGHNVPFIFNMITKRHLLTTKREYITQRMHTTINLITKKIQFTHNFILKDSKYPSKTKSRNKHKTYLPYIRICHLNYIVIIKIHLDKNVIVQVGKVIIVQPSLTVNRWPIS